MKLSNNDAQIIKLLSEGEVVKQIGEKVGTTKYSVFKRLQKIREVNECVTYAQLVAKALREGAIQ